MLLTQLHEASFPESKAHCALSDSVHRAPHQVVSPLPQRLRKSCLTEFPTGLKGPLHHSEVLCSRMGHLWITQLAAILVSSCSAQRCGFGSYSRLGHCLTLPKLPPGRPPEPPHGAQTTPESLWLLLPGHEASKARPGGLTDEEAHHGICDGIPCPAHEQDDGGIERIQLQWGGEDRIQL